MGRIGGWTEPAPGVIRGVMSGLLAVSIAAAAPESDGRVSVRIDDQPGVTRLEFTVNSFDLRGSDEPESARMDGCEPVLSIAGLPELPIVSRTLLLPQGCDAVLTVEEVSRDRTRSLRPTIAQRVAGDASDTLSVWDRAPLLMAGKNPPLLPPYFAGGEVQPNHDFAGGEDWKDTPPYSPPATARGVNAVEEGEEAWWPPQPVVLSDPAILRGYRLVNIYYFPIQYNLETGESRLNASATASVEYIHSPAAALITPKPSAWTDRLLRNLVENPPPRRDDYLSGRYLYLAPNAQGVWAALAPLLEWRRRQGHRVALALLPVNVNTGTIANEIREAYNSEDPVEFVCLVGDTDSRNSAIVLPPVTAFSDYNYSCIEGDDRLPEVAIGRISVSTVAELTRVVGKIVGYESDPYMDDTDWFKQGVVVAGSTNNGLSTVLVAKWVRRELLKLGFTDVRHWYHTEDGSIGGNQQFLQDAFEWGVGLVHYRAFSRMNDLDQNVIVNLRNTDGRWPPVLAISCNTGNFAVERSHTEVFLRSRGGGVGAIGTATPNTNVKFNNLVAGGVWKGIYLDSLYAFGWGLVAGKLELWRAYDGLDNDYRNFLEWNNLMGDPGTHIWSDIPREIEVSAPEVIPVGCSRLEVSVAEVEREVQLADALVCISQADGIQLTAWTDGDGRAVFHLPPDGVEAGGLMLTVTKHNVLPWLGGIDVEEAEYHIGAGDWEFTGEDATPNPGDELTLVVQIVNYGERAPEGGLTVSMEYHDPGGLELASVVGDPVEFEEAPGSGEAVEAEFSLRISPACPDGAILMFDLTAAVGDDEWVSSLEMTNSAPRIEVCGLQYDADELKSRQTCRLQVKLRNTGSQILQPTHTTLWSEDDVIIVRQNETYYPAIGVSEEDLDEEEGFLIRAHPLAVPGTKGRLGIAVETRDGFRDTTVFELQVAVPDMGDPIGPDYYGYVCYDSFDEDWVDAPEFDWVEINPNEDEDYRGTRINLSDPDDNEDVSTVIGLPFEFTYYGEVFESITVCTNGWAAFGSQAELADFRNRRIGQALGPCAQLCVWWDNLITVNNQSGMYYYHDRDGGRFIIEWFRMQRLVEGGNGAWETFQIVLLDPEEHPTATGDGIIMFQYLDVTNQNAEAHNDTPFCTIGISDPNDREGLEYTYWGQYPPGAHPIESEMALVFRTISDYESGSIEGTVRDAGTNQPLEDVEVSTDRGFWAITDRDGYYLIDAVLPEENISLTARKVGWCDSTIFGIDLAADQLIGVDFGLLHPEIEPSIDAINGRQRAGTVEEYPLIIANRGNGPLDWSFSRRLRNGEGLDYLELRGSVDAGAACQDDEISGVALVGDRYFVTGNGGENDLIYELSRDGRLERFMRQPGDGGMGGLTWDGELLWSGSGATIYGFDLAGEVQVQFDGPYNPNFLLAWDGDRSVLWVGHLSRNLTSYDREGNRLENILNRRSLRIYSIAYDPEDLDGYNLYLNTSNDGIVQNLFKMSPETGDTMFVRRLPLPQVDEIGFGACITTAFNPLSRVLITVADRDQGDRLHIWQLGDNTAWLNMQPSEGRVNAGRELDADLVIDATGLTEGYYEGEAILAHNGLGGDLTLPVALFVSPRPGDPAVRLLEFHPNWNMVSLNIAPEVTHVPTLLDSLFDAGALLFIRDGSGRFYDPESGVNMIQGWDYQNGYMVYATGEAALEVAGQTIDSDQPIQLLEGWNLVSYLLNNATPVQTALVGIGDALFMARDEDGNFYLPEFDYCNMPPLKQGRGYQLAVTEDVELLYNQGEGLFGEIGDGGSSAPIALNTRKYPKPQPRLMGMSVLLLGADDMRGWEAGVFVGDGMLVGSGVFDAEGRCGMAVWSGDDLSGGMVLQTGTPIEFKLWDGSRELAALVIPRLGQAVWERDGILVADVEVTPTVPLVFGLTGASPNPFNGAMTVDFALAEGGLTRLAVYDLAGRLAAEPLNGDLSAGSHRISCQAGELASGVYLLKLQQAGRSATIKVALVR